MPRQSVLSRNPRKPILKPPPEWAAVCTWHVVFTKELRHIHCHSEEVVFRLVFVRDVSPVGIQ